jgi:hypothetical protein
VGLAAATALTEQPLRAQETPQKEKTWYEALDVGTFVSVSYLYGFNRPDSSTNQYRVFDTDEGSLKLDVATVVVQKTASAPGEGGFRVDLMAGASIPKVVAASGLFRDELTGKAQDIDLFQAFVSYIAPVAKGIRIDAGKFATHMGYEVVEGRDSYGDNASRSLLFGWAIPFTQTGLRVSYPFSEKLSAQVHLVNGWDDVKDNNSAKSFGAQLLYTPSPSISAALNVVSGPEKAGNTADRRDALDFWASWKATERLTLAVNADTGAEQNDLPDGGRATWSGVAIYAGYRFTDRLSLNLRAELFRDRDGARTGVSQTLREVTLTPEWKLGKDIRVRGDLRYDRSDEPVFARRDGHSRDQATASLNVLWVH